jgi:hypothetical protein
MGTSGEFSAAGAMTILKYTHIPGDPVTHFVAQTTAVNLFFRHWFNSRFQQFLLARISLIISFAQSPVRYRPV